MHRVLVLVGTVAVATRASAGAPAAETKAELKNVHMCCDGCAEESCGGCVKSLREAVKDVKGVAGVSAKTKVSTAGVTGEFDAAELVKALNKAGFHVQVQEKK